jgi:hypothetical protein
LAVALTAPTKAQRGPKAASRRAYRDAAQLPTPPLGVEVLAAVAKARAGADREFAWDARLEASLIAVLTYLWRRGRGEKWAGACGSARYGCSFSQLVMGLAPIMGWRDVPQLSRDPTVGHRLRRHRYDQQVARFARRHRKSVQRWLAWLQRAGLITHTPQQDEEGFWWRTVIELCAVPALPAELLEAAARRRRAWPASERRRRQRGRARDLTTILGRARLTAAQRRARGVQRRRQLACDAERVRVRTLVAQSLADAALQHQTHPFGASPTSRRSLERSEHHKRELRGNAGARAAVNLIASALPANGIGTERGQAPAGEELRWAIYREVMAQRFARDEQDWAPGVAALRRRAGELAEWPAEQQCPRRRLIEAWALAAHGPVMTAAGGLRLALWREDRDHHGARLDRALSRYRRHAGARPPGWPEAPVAGFARFLAELVRPLEGPAHGMAYDVQCFNELTKRMSAYAHVTRAENAARAAARARRRAAVRQLAEQTNLRLRFRVEGASRVQLARDLLDSDHPAHHAAGRRLYTAAEREAAAELRDRRVAAGEDPGPLDGRYRAAIRHASRWGLPAPRWDAGTPQ